MEKYGKEKKMDRQEKKSSQMQAKGKTLIIYKCREKPNFTREKNGKKDRIDKVNKNEQT